MDWVDDTVFSIKLSIDIFPGISLNLGVGGVGAKDPVGTADCLTLITSLIILFFSAQWWNVVTGEPSQTFYTNGTNLKKIHVSPDFKTYVTVDNLGILYILKILE